VGLLALMEVARLAPAAVDAEAIGFQLGPRMNAVGRLDDAAVAVELLTTRDALRARQLAATMERLNQERRLLTSQTTAAALEMVDRNPSLLDFSALVLHHHAWHAGIVGIVASRLAEQFHRPVVLLTTPPGQPARGSARSVAGVDIGAAIAACADLLIQSGGHPGAAGVTLLPEKIDAFRRRLHQQVEAARLAAAEAGAPTPALVVDAQLPLADLSLPLAQEIQRLAPFGHGNPTPQFLSAGLQVVDDRRLGRDGTHRRLQVMAPDQATASVIWFHGADTELPPAPLDLVYTLGVNEYRGERTLQIQFVAARTTPAAPSVSLAARGQARRLHDLRRAEVDPARLPQPPAAVWYAEGAEVGAGAASPAYAPRTEVGRARRGAPLVLWSIPPSRATLAWLLDAVQPAEVYVCGRATAGDRPDLVVRQVAGLCKFALGRDGLLDIGRMAARLGLTEAAVRHALLLLESRGQIRIDEWSPAGADSLRIAPGAASSGAANSGAANSGDQDLLWTQLVEQLAEVRAFRRFFQRAAVDELGLDTSP
jgi:single-stranded-DNA-specific exonuclease